MADTSGNAGAFALAGDGLRAVTWDGCDAPLCGCFTASPADAEGRGLALSVTRGGEAVNLTGASVYLLWRHRERRARGCAPFEAVDAAAGSFRVFWPAAMACAEGTADAQVVVCQDGEAISSLPFSVRVVAALGAGEGGGDDGYSLFLEALERLEGADELIAEALAQAQQAADAAAEALEDAQGAAAAIDAANEAAAAADEAREDLLAAAERGDFDGAPGAPGAPGQDGAPGAPGVDGADGVSPSASVAQTAEGAVVTVTDAGGTTTATLLHGEKGDKGDAGDPGEKGDAFTYDDFTAEQLEALRGPQGEPGEDGVDGAPALKTIAGTINPSNQISQIMLPSGSYEVGDYAEGDFVLDAAMTLGRVTEAEVVTLGRLSVMVRYLARLRPDGLATCTGADLDPGETSQADILVHGQDLREGDLALSTDTGCLCEISQTGVAYLDRVYARLTCLTAFATRGYVDQAIAALDDLSEVEF